MRVFHFGDNGAAKIGDIREGASGRTIQSVQVTLILAMHPFLTRGSLVTTCWGHMCSYESLPHPELPVSPFSTTPACSRSPLSARLLLWVCDNTG